MRAPKPHQLARNAGGRLCLSGRLFAANRRAAQESVRVLTRPDSTLAAFAACCLSVYPDSRTGTRTNGAGRGGGGRAVLAPTGGGGRRRSTGGGGGGRNGRRGCCCAVWASVLGASGPAAAVAGMQSSRAASSAGTQRMWPRHGGVRRSGRESLPLSRKRVAVLRAVANT